MREVIPRYPRDLRQGRVFGPGALTPNRRRSATNFTATDLSRRQALLTGPAARRRRPGCPRAGTRASQPVSAARHLPGPSPQGPVPQDGLATHRTDAGSRRPASRSDNRAPDAGLKADAGTRITAPQPPSYRGREAPRSRLARRPHDRPDDRRLLDLLVPVRTAATMALLLMGPRPS